jgi:hypothetical protein
MISIPNVFHSDKYVTTYIEHESRENYELGNWDSISGKDKKRSMLNSIQIDHRAQPVSYLIGIDGPF